MSNDSTKSTQQGLVTSGTAALKVMTASLSLDSSNTIDRAGEKTSLSLSAPLFDHHVAELDNLRLHYITSGKGEPVVLLAGFPQTCYAWRKVMPLLANSYQVFAVDLPGQGDSSKPATGYDTRSMAEAIHRWLEQLAIGPVFLGAHDVGAWVAYPLAAIYPSDIRRLVMLDASIAGVTLPDTLPIRPESWKSFHFLFHLVADFPEQLIAGRERDYIAWFLQSKAFDPSVFTNVDLDEYARCYRMAGGMRAALEWYRAVPINAEQNREFAKKKLEMPILALGGRQGSSPNITESMRQLAHQVEGGVLEQCGHYVPEEQPYELANYMLKFFAEDNTFG